MVVGAEFYSAASQVIPVLVLAVTLQVREVDRVAERARNLRSQADVAMAPALAVIKEMADGKRPIEQAPRYQYLQLAQALRLFLLSQRDRRRLAPVRWAIVAGGMSEVLALGTLWFGLGGWPVALGVGVGVLCCATVLGLLAWGRLGGTDLLLGDPRWARDPFPAVDAEQAASHQAVLDLISEGLGSGRLSESDLQEILAMRSDGSPTPGNTR